jgi:hypothetical protein
MISLRTNGTAFFGLLIAAFIIGCHHRSSYYVGPPIKGLSFHAEAATVGPLGDALSVRVIARNNSNGPVSIEFSGCSRVNPIAAVAISKGRKWISRTWETQRIEQTRPAVGSRLQEVCAGGHVVGSFLRGSAHTFSLTIPVVEILGDSLDPGTYRVTTSLDINGRHVRNLFAGDVEITRPPPDTR